MALSVSSYWAAIHPDGEKNVILSNTMHRGLLGFSMSAVNPVQIPFWFGWSTVLFSKNILRPGFWNYNVYIAGIGLGTLAGNSVFIFGGRLIVERLNASNTIMNYIIGTVFLITAIIQFIRIRNKKDAVHKLEHPEEVTAGLEEKIH